MYACMCVYIYIYILYVCVYIYIYLYVSVCVCVCVHMPYVCMQKAYICIHVRECSAHFEVVGQDSRFGLRPFVLKVFVALLHEWPQ